MLHRDIVEKSGFRPLEAVELECVSGGIAGGLDNPTVWDNPFGGGGIPGDDNAGFGWFGDQLAQWGVGAFLDGLFGSGGGGDGWSTADAEAALDDEFDTNNIKHQWNDNGANYWVMNDGTAFIDKDENGAPDVMVTKGGDGNLYTNDGQTTKLFPYAAFD